MKNSGKGKGRKDKESRKNFQQPPPPMGVITKFIIIIEIFQRKTLRPSFYFQLTYFLDYQMKFG